MITEGYSGLPPLPPTGGLTSGSPEPLQFTVYSARGVKKHRVLRCFGPFVVPEFDLGAIKKPCVLRGFGVQGLPRDGKNDMLKMF